MPYANLNFYNKHMLIVDLGDRLGAEIWNLVNHTFPFLRLVLADIDGSALMITNVDHQIEQHLNIVLCRVQI